MGCAKCAGASQSTGCACGAFTTVESVLGYTVIDMLAPAVDCARDLYTQLGLRTYAVTLVWTRWSGGSRGRGQEFIVGTFAILPTPMVPDLTALSLELKEIGMNEQGSLTVSQISPRFGEDLLMGRDHVIPTGSKIPSDMDFFWEIYMPSPDGKGIRRRFFPSSAPSLDAGKFEWTIQLKEQEGSRARNGRLQ
jgi:hypothetical protein